MPKISVVMSLFNTPVELFKTTVKSILNQTFGDFEFIIVDDSTEENYEEILKSFGDERIKYFKNDVNNGPGPARNTGIRMSQGEFVAIVDSDDVYMPNRFELQLKFFEQHPDISLTAGAFKYSNNGKIPSVLEKDEDIKVYMLFNAPIANPVAMFRRDVFLEKNLFYPNVHKFGEDYDLWLDAMFAGVKMANLKELLMTYTRRSGQLSKAKEDYQIKSLKEIYQKTLTRFGLNPTPEDIELHYNIYAQNFESLTIEQVRVWFERIIEQNRKINLLDENAIVKFMNQMIEKMQNSHNRLFKIKIGQYNFCLSKKLRPYVEKRD